ncbi:MAG: hypothetical protein V4787_10865 [Pseudomonadota bacterium]
MAKPLILILLAVLSGCSTVVVQPNTASPCSVNEASYDCQVERYHNVNAD